MVKKAIFNKCNNYSYNVAVRHNADVNSVTVRINTYNTNFYSCFGVRQQLHPYGLSRRLTVYPLY